MRPGRGEEAEHPKRDTHHVLQQALRCGDWAEVLGRPGVPRGGTIADAHVCVGTRYPGARRADCLDRVLITSGQTAVIFIVESCCISKTDYARTDVSN